MKTKRGGIAVIVLALCAAVCGASGQNLLKPPKEPLQPEEVPQSGNFYSMQRTDQPPLPFCPIPGADLFIVDANTYLYNDMDVDYVRMEQETMTLDLRNKAARSSLLSDSGGDPESGDPPPAYDYPPGSLWIEIYSVTNDLAYMTVHGTYLGVEYQLQSRPSLDVTASWSPEQNFTGAEPDTVLAPVPLQGRPMCFFRVATCGVLAFDQLVTTGVGQPVTITLCASNPCGVPTITVQAGPTYGTLTGTGLTRTYTPTNPSFVGDDSFIYTADGSPATVTIEVLSSPILITSCREDRILLHWTIPELKALSGFKVYRCANASGCTPGEGDLLATVLASEIQNSFPRDYTDTNNLQSGVNYCYRVKLMVQRDECDPAVYYDSGFSNTSCNQLCPSPNALIVGNCASVWNPGPIQTFEFATGNLVNSCTPESAGNGRGLAIRGAEVFYTEWHDDSIHVCPYGVAGYVDDIRTLQNTWRPGVSIQDLAFHNNVLYALTGYPDQQLQVFILNPNSGAVLGGPIPIGSPASSDSDGFTVLATGNFLINDFDGYGGCTRYREYNSTNGVHITSGLDIDLAQFGFAQGRGVARAPDGQSLYFIAASTALVEEADTIVQTDLAGDLIGFQPINPTRVEDIDIVVP